MLEKGSLICHGTGEEIREYIDVRDAARLSVEILDEEYKNRHIIISGHHPMKFKEMIMMIKEIIGNDVSVEFVGGKNVDHYNYTPYSFTPKVGHKLVNYCYIDMGQGILECLHELYAEQNGKD